MLGNIQETGSCFRLFGEKRNVIRKLDGFWAWLKGNYLDLRFLYSYSCYVTDMVWMEKILQVNDMSQNLSKWKSLGFPFSLFVLNESVAKDGFSDS